VHRRALGHLAAIVAGIVLTPACRQVVGITDSAPEKLTATVCGMPYGTTTCAACASANCCAESSACAADATCSAYESCLGACSGDPACRSKCTIDHPVGTEASDVSAVSACLAAKCEAACELPCGGVAAYIAEPQNAAACQECITSGNACSPARAWGASVEGDAYWRCVLSAGADDVRQGCAADDGAGATLFSAFEADWQGPCMKQCAFGNYWACVGHVTWPLAQPRPLSVTVGVVDFGNASQGTRDLSAEVCTGCPCTALTPLYTGETNSKGLFSYTIDNVVDEAGHGLDGCLQISSPDVVPMYVYWDYPFSVSVGIADGTNPNELIRSVTPMEFQAYQNSLGIMQDASLGYVSGIVKDCLGFPAPGVQVKVDGDQTGIERWYGTLNLSATATDATGLVGFFNVPVGDRLLTATPIGLVRPSSLFEVASQAGVITETQIYPTP
jgi:hypothetical protein